MSKFNILFLILLLWTKSSFASCDELYPNKTPIIVKDTIELCNSFFVVRYNKEKNATILVSERLLKASSVGSATRLNAFRTDPRVPAVTNKDYASSGYDKGHMAPADDASTNEEMYDTFYLSNMTPQKPTLNREAWKKLEMLVRKIWANSPTDVYVLTIAIYNKPSYVNNKIPIPSGYWKIVYADGKSRYFFAENIDYGQVKEYSPINVNFLTRPGW